MAAQLALKPIQHGDLRDDKQALLILRMSSVSTALNLDLFARGAPETT